MENDRPAAGSQPPSQPHPLSGGSAPAILAEFRAALVARDIVPPDPSSQTASCTVATQPGRAAAVMPPTCCIWMDFPPAASRTGGMDGDGKHGDLHPARH